MERSKKRKYVNVPVRERKALSRSRCWYTSLQGDYFRIEKLAFPLSHFYSVLRWGEINVVMTPGLSVKYIISFFFCYHQWYLLSTSTDSLNLLSFVFCHCRLSVITLVPIPTNCWVTPANLCTLIGLGTGVPYLQPPTRPKYRGT